MTMWTRFRDAVTGRFTTRAEAKERPRETVGETPWPMTRREQREDYAGREISAPPAIKIAPGRDNLLTTQIVNVLKDRIPGAPADQIIAAARRVMHIPRIKEALFGLDQRETNAR